MLYGMQRFVVETIQRVEVDINSICCIIQIIHYIFLIRLTV